MAEGEKETSVCSHMKALATCDIKTWKQRLPAELRACGWFPCLSLSMDNNVQEKTR